MTRFTAEEEKKFKHLMRVLLWAKKTTKKSSGQIVSTLLSKNNKDLLVGPQL